MRCGGDRLPTPTRGLSNMACPECRKPPPRNNHHFTTAAATDGSLKIAGNGKRRVAYGIEKGIQPIDQAKSDRLEEKGEAESRHDIHLRVGDGIS